MKAFKLVALVGVLTFTVASSAMALPGAEYINTYYADASMQEIVGSKYLICNGNHASWGVETAFVESETASCNTGGGESAPDAVCNDFPEDGVPWVCYFDG